MKVTILKFDPYINVVVKQTAFGIKPFSKALGMVKVKDEVRFELRVVASAEPAGR